MKEKTGENVLPKKCPGSRLVGPRDVVVVAFALEKSQNRNPDKGFSTRIAKRLTLGLIRSVVRAHLRRGEVPRDALFTGQHRSLYFINLFKLNFL